MSKLTSAAGLSLPEDAEPFIPEGEDLSALSNPGVYALSLSRPDDLAAAWDATFDARPAYWDDLQEAESVVYVGASNNVLARLEDHRDADLRKAALLNVCDLEALRTIWWFDSADEAFQNESKIALQLQVERPDLYVHQR